MPEITLIRQSRRQFSGILLLIILLLPCLAVRALDIIDVTDMKRGSLFQPYLLSFALTEKAGVNLKTAPAGEAVKLLKSGAADLVLVREKYLPEFGAEWEKRYFGSRPVGVYLHNLNSKNDLSLKELGEIVSEPQPTWEKYTGDKAVIHRYSLAPQGVSESLPEEYFKLPSRPGFVFFRSNKEILLLLKDDAVGIVLGKLQLYDFPEDVKLISVDGVKPSLDNIHNGSYPVSIRYFLVWNAKGKNSAQVDKFIRVLQKRFSGDRKTADFFPAPWLINGW